MIIFMSLHIILCHFVDTLFYYIMRFVQKQEEGTTICIRPHSLRLDALANAQFPSHCTNTCFQHLPNHSELGLICLLCYVVWIMADS